jgi:tRNA pseudouridine38-40 synthase
MGLYKSVIRYDGTDFHGFQRQAEGIRTVQGEVEQALHTIGWMGDSLSAAGRTDAGVHARGQVIAYNLEWRASEDELTRALNANLPTEIAVWRTETVAEDFHPRFSATGRRYEYYVHAAPVRTPLRERYSWRVWPEPESELLALAGEKILGRKDFAAFGQAPAEGGHTTREVRRADWSRIEDGLRFDIEANAFLHHMVRRVVAAMVSVGQGRIELSYIEELIQDPTKRWQGSIAPPNGLFLERVYYGNRSVAPIEE